MRHLTFIYLFVLLILFFSIAGCENIEDLIGEPETEIVEEDTVIETDTPSIPQTDIIYEDEFAVWQHTGDIENSTLTIDEDAQEATLVVDNTLLGFTRLQHSLSGENVEDFRGEILRMSVVVEVTGLSAGGFVILLVDKCAETEEYEHTFSKVIDSDGEYDLAVSRAMRDIELSSIGIIPGQFRPETNAGAKAVIKSIVVERLID